MSKQSTLNYQFKTAIFAGFFIAFSWIFIQNLFFYQGWAQPGTTSFSLFFTQSIAVTLLLFFSFKWYRNQNVGGIVSFGKLMQQGVLTGVGVLIFGTIIFQLYINFINPNHLGWLDEMYNLSWMQRGLTDAEIQSQQATNDWLNSPIGLLYGAFFVVFLIIIYSVIPAILIMKRKDNSNKVWSTKMA